MKDYPFQENYQILEEIGHGAFGSAYKVFNKDDNTIYVIKKIITNHSDQSVIDKALELEQIQKEANILSTINSEYIVKFIKSFETPNSFNIVMEYCEGLDLRKFIAYHILSKKQIDKKLIYHIIYDICYGLKEIHSRNLIHRDIKPENLLLTRDLKIKIADFGISKQLSQETQYAKTQTGTIRYMAPEIILGEKYKDKVDIWSLGCIIYEMCKLEFCFGDCNIMSLVDKITNCKFNHIDENIYGKELQELIELCLQKDPSKRPTVDEIIKYLDSLNINLENITIINLFKADEAYQNYIIEKQVNLSLEQMSTSIITSELNPGFPQYIQRLLNLGLLGGFFTGGISFLGLVGLYIVNNLFFNKVFSKDSQKSFIFENDAIVSMIQSDIEEKIKIKIKLEEKIKGEKIIILSKKQFNIQLDIVKKVLISQKFIQKMRAIITKNFNILLLGNKNTGKSTLINEFLKLKKNLRAKESDGGENTITDFKPYNGKINNQKFTIYDTNGISENEDIEAKIKKISEKIEKSFKSNDPNQLIHCIWYCFQSSNINSQDKEFIQKLLNICKTYNIPIIFIHTRTCANNQNIKYVEEYLTELKDKDKIIEKQNYVEILARDEDKEGKKAFGLKDLERMTLKHIEVKGFKSSYFEYISGKVITILINSVFHLIFTNDNIDLLTNKARENLKDFINAINNMINDDKFGLDFEAKKKNSTVLFNLYKIILDSQKSLENELKNLINLQYLKDN